MAWYWRAAGWVSLGDYLRAGQHWPVFSAPAGYALRKRGYLMEQTLIVGSIRRPNCWEANCWNGTSG